MTDIFELVEATAKQVILKVKPMNNLTIARYPFVNSEYDYITVSRGKTQLLTVIRKNGTTFSFHWGDGGRTLISEELERLKASVIDFIQHECTILLGWDLATPPNKISVFYNPYFDCWMFRAESTDRKGNHHEARYCSDWAENEVEIIADVCDFFPEYKNASWSSRIATTGIRVWEATLNV